MSRRKKEPPAPTPLDEAMSLASLDSSPWVLERIKKLRIEGKLVKGWTPPEVSVFRCDLTRVTQCSP